MDVTQLGSGKPLRVGRDVLETFPGDYAHRVAIAGSELQSVCPITEQPDVYSWKLNYDGPGLYIESKSLKGYLRSWRDVGITCEALAQAIADDISAALNGTWVAVELTQNVRGGMQITALAQSVTTEGQDDD